eukprot:Opistho-1_new@1079
MDTPDAEADVSGPPSREADDVASQSGRLTAGAVACQNCRQGHRQCDGNTPCNRCVRLDKASSCCYLPPMKKGRKKASDSVNSVKPSRRGGAATPSIASVLAHGRLDGDSRRTLFDSSLVTSFCDEKGHYVMFSPGYCRLLGHPEGFLVGYPWQSTVHPDSVALGKQNAEELVQRVNSDDEDQRRAGVMFEAIRVRRDGSAFQATQWLSVLWRENNQIGGFICSVIMGTIRERPDKTMAPSMLAWANDTIARVKEQAPPPQTFTHPTVVVPLTVRPGPPSATTPRYGGPDASPFALSAMYGQQMPFFSSLSAPSTPRNFAYEHGMVPPLVQAPSIPVSVVDGPPDGMLYRGHYGPPMAQFRQAGSYGPPMGYYGFGMPSSPRVVPPVGGSQAQQMPPQQQFGGAEGGTVVDAQSGFAAQGQSLAQSSEEDVRRLAFRR